MDNSLKEIIEEFVVSSVKQLQTDRAFKNNHVKRIILTTLPKIKNETLVFNYTENRFLNQQYIIDKKIPIVIMPYYSERYRKQGDWSLDIGSFLEDRHLKSSAYTDF